MRSLTRLRKLLNKAIRTSHENVVVTASTYITIIYSKTTRSDRLSLVMQLFRDHNFGLEELLVNTNPPPHEILDDDEIEAFDNRLREPVEQLARELAGYELSLKDAAARWFDFLDDLPNDQQRTVALARFLKAGVRPYVQIPETIFIEGDLGEAVRRIDSTANHEQVRRSCIIISQMIGHPRFPHPSLVARGVAKLLSRHHDPDEAAILLGHFISIMIRRGAKSGLDFLEVISGVSQDEEDEFEGKSLQEISDADLVKHISTCGAPDCKFQSEYDRRQREKKRPQA